MRYNFLKFRWILMEIIELKWNNDYPWTSMLYVCRHRENIAINAAGKKKSVTLSNVGIFNFIIDLISLFHNTIWKWGMFTLRSWCNFMELRRRWDLTCKPANDKKFSLRDVQVHHSLEQTISANKHFWIWYLSFYTSRFSTLSQLRLLLGCSVMNKFSSVTYCLINFLLWFFYLIGCQLSANY